MGKFKRSKNKRKRRFIEQRCFDRGSFFIVCKLTNAGWVEIDDMTFDTCEECTRAIGTTKCYE